LADGGAGGVQLVLVPLELLPASVPDPPGDPDPPPDDDGATPLDEDADVPPDELGVAPLDDADDPLDEPELELLDDADDPLDEPELEPLDDADDPLGPLDEPELPLPPSPVPDALSDVLEQAATLSAKAISPVDAARHIDFTAKAFILQ